MSGPPPKPTALKVLEGNPGKRRLNRREPKPPLKVPRRPSYLDPIAREAWDETVPLLKSMKLLTKIDRIALETFANAYSQMRRSLAYIEEHGQFQTNADGLETMRPSFHALRSSMQLIKAFCAEFGMTPSSRGRMVVPGADTDDSEMASLLS